MLHACATDGTIHLSVGLLHGWSESILAPALGEQRGEWSKTRQETQGYARRTAVGDWRRTAVRRRAGLPLLNVRAELEEALASRKPHSYETELAQVTGQLGAQIAEKYLARHRRRLGKREYEPRCAVGRMLMKRHLRRVLERILRVRTGAARPRPSRRGLVIYGSDRDAP